MKYYDSEFSAAESEILYQRLDRLTSQMGAEASALLELVPLAHQRQELIVQIKIQERVLKVTVEGTKLSTMLDAAEAKLWELWSQATPPLKVVVAESVVH